MVKSEKRSLLRYPCAAVLNSLAVFVEAAPHGVVLSVDGAAEGFDSGCGAFLRMVSKGAFAYICDGDADASARRGDL